MEKTNLKPFVKWAGGKRQLIPQMKKFFQFDEKIKKYAEPFIGGGAVLFYLLENVAFEKIFICDVNSELINCYREIRDDVENLISRLNLLEQKFFQATDQKYFFEEQRNLFNDGKKSSDIFIFLNRTCFNGLYRVNSRGKFNVSFGRYKNPKICDSENLRQLSKILQQVEICVGDYHISSNFIDSSTFVYFDLPYRPLNATSIFTSYTEKNFDDDDQENLAK